MESKITQQYTDNFKIELSVIVPVYCVEPYLERCLNSISCQQVFGMEVLLIDDASPDYSPKICEKWAQKDSRFKVFHHSTNMGVGEARNTGLRNASGKFVFFCDSDDYLPPAVLPKLISMMESSGADIVRGTYRECFEGEISEKEIGIHTVYDQINMFSCCMLRLDFLSHNRIQFPSLNIAEDQVFMLKALLARPKFQISDTCCYVYCRYNTRFNQNRYTTYDLIPQLFAVCEMLNCIMEQDGFHLLECVIASMNCIALHAEFRVQSMDRVELKMLSQALVQLQDTIAQCKKRYIVPKEADDAVETIKSLLDKYYSNLQRIYTTDLSTEAGEKMIRSSNNECTGRI